MSTDEEGVMSTEKSCAKCVIDFCDAFNSSQSNNCNRHDNVYYCSTVCATIRNLTPAQKHAEELLKAQKHAEELLEALKKDHKSYHKMYRENDIGKCPTCQLIARAEGRE